VGAQTNDATNTLKAHLFVMREEGEREERRPKTLVEDRTGRGSVWSRKNLVKHTNREDRNGPRPAGKKAYDQKTQNTRG